MIKVENYMLVVVIVITDNVQQVNKGLFIIGLIYFHLSFLLLPSYETSVDRIICRLESPSYHSIFIFYLSDFLCLFLFCMLLKHKKSDK